MIHLPIATVTSQETLFACMQNVTEPECVVPPNTVIYLNSAMDHNHVLTLRGSANSIIDLQYKSTLN
jgi:hypothetical protein